MCCLLTIKNWWFYIFSHFLGFWGKMCLGLLGSSGIVNIGTFVSNLLLCIIFFLISSLCISNRGRPTMFGSAPLKWWMTTITPKTRSFFQEGSSLKIHLLTCHPLVNTSCHSTLPTINFVKIFSFFYALVFSLCGFFIGHGLLECSKLVITYSRILGVSCQFVLFNLKNFKELIAMITNVLRSFILWFFKSKTFLNTSPWKFIVNYINWANKTNYLFLFRILEHEDHHKLVNPNLQCMDGHFLYGLLIIVFNEVELHQGLLCKH